MSTQNTWQQSWGCQLIQQIFHNQKLYLQSDETNETGFI